MRLNKAMREEIVKNARAIVNSVTSADKLLEVWPEAVELLPNGATTVKGGLPSVNVAQLNTVIGLPTEGKKKCK